MTLAACSAVSISPPLSRPQAKQEKIPEIEKAGADGIVNLNLKEKQHPTAVKAIFAVLFVIPLPSYVEVTGELVKFTQPLAN